MGVLTKDAILAANDLKSETITVEEWGGDVVVRGMRGTERDAFEVSLFIGDGDNKKFSADNVRAKLLARCLVDEQGSRLFTDADIVALGNKNAAVLDRLYEVAQRLCGLGTKELAAAVKN